MTNHLVRFSFYDRYLINKKKKNIFCLDAVSLLIKCFLVFASVFTPPQYIYPSEGKLSPELETAISSAKSPNEKFRVIIIMSARYTFAPYTVSVKEQRDYIYKKRIEELKSFAASDQKNIIEFLEKEKSTGGVDGEIKSNLIKNFVSATISAFVIKEKIVKRDDVSFILLYDDKIFSDQNVSDAALNILDYSRDYQSALNRLNDANPLMRRTAINYLGRLKNPDSIKPLLNTLSDEDPLVRRTAVEALANFKGDQSVINAILSVLKKETDVSVKISAIRAAGEIGSGAFVETLKNLATDQFAIYRAEAIKSLARISPSSESVMRIVIKAISDEAEGVRIAAMDVASRNNYQMAVPNIISNITDPVALVRRASCEALGRLGTKQEHIELLEKIALEDGDNTVRVEAANAAELIRSRMKVPRR